MNAVYRVSGPDIVFENFDGDLVVLDLASGKYYGFNASAANVWAALMAGASVGDVVKHCGIEDEVFSFVGKLIQIGLLVRSGDSKEGADPDPDLISRLQSESEAPNVEIYDDLADLIMADPIHDTDSEVGWPHIA